MITIKLVGFEEALRTIDPEVAKKATKAALDRTAQSGKTTASEEIRAVWNVKKSDLDPGIKIYPSRSNDLKAVIAISGKPMSLAYFGAKQIFGATVRSRVGKNLRDGKVTRKLRSAGPLPQGVVVQIMKGKETVMMHSAFLSRMPRKGNIGVFRRSSKDRLPIDEKNVISIASMANRPEVMTAMIKRIQQRWLAEFPHQLKYYQERGAR